MSTMSVTGYPFDGYDGSGESFEALLDARPPPEPGSDAEFDLMANGPAEGNHPEGTMTVTVAAGSHPAPWKKMIPVDRLHLNPDNPRQDPGDIAGLAASIRASGLKQALLVYPARDIGPDDYYIEDGWRRLLAMQDWCTEIPCDIHPVLAGEPLATRNVLTALITGIHRKALNPMERADGYQSLADKGMTAVEIGKLIGLAPSTVTNDLALLELTRDTQDRVRSGKLTATEALRIVRRHRKAQRRKKGQPDRGARWEADWFTTRHPLARIARAMCDAREHNSRRRLGNVACGQCFDDAIRADQRKIDAAEQAARERFASAMDQRDAGPEDSGRPEDQEAGS